jgi:hypothetical protein
VQLQKTLHALYGGSMRAMSAMLCTGGACRAALA